MRIFYILSSLQTFLVHNNSIFINLFQQVYEELEHLRKLVQKYRLELSNREGNFNRMFTDQTPVHVDQRSMKPLAPLPLRAPVRDRSHLSQSTDMLADTDRVGKNG